MCGIAGIAGPSSDVIAEQMIEVLRHRGPDDTGLCARPAFAMGTSRLSLVDIASGAQPTYNETGSIAVCFNGEIYNHRALRHLLREAGHTFRSESDTEVIVHLYEMHGERCVDYLHGMFAFAVLDGDRLLLARDRMGIKPLYYVSLPESGQFVFASEIKAILQCTDYTPRLDTEALADTALLGYPCGVTTFFKDIRLLAPGHTLSVALDPGPRVDPPRRYFHKPAVRTDLSMLQAQEALGTTLASAVASHLSADVEVGLTLSGGIDSTVMALLARECQRDRPLLTFSIADNEQHTDLLQAAMVAQLVGSEHVPVIVSFAEYLDAIPAYVAAEESLTDLHVLPFFLLARRIGERVKACLYGEGADELFGGYPEYLDRSQRQQWLPQRLADLRARGVMPGPHAQNLVRRYARASGFDAYLQLVFEDNLGDPLERQHLHPADKCAMASSVEARVPYLDDGVVALVTSLPIAYRVRPDLGIRKHILRRLCLERFGMATADIVLRDKQSLPTSGQRHLQRFKQLCADRLPDSYVKSHEFANYFSEKSELLLFDLFCEIFFVHRGRHDRVGSIEDFIAARAGRKSL